MDILDKFISKAKESIAEGYYEQAVECREKKVSLLKKIKSQEFTLITEIKHASPIGEYEYKKIDPESAANEFRANGSDAISVVVEPKIFKGEIGNVSLAKRAGLPVLFKDFVISKAQIKAAKKSGADAVLLVFQALNREKVDLDGMIKAAHSAGLEVLLECYDEAEFKAAVKTDADILGINNRDLRTLKVDLGRTEEIMENVGDNGKPVISESGMKTGEDVRRIKRAGVNGALVGTAIWTAKNLGEKIKELKEGGKNE